MRHKLISVFLMACILLMMPLPAYAQVFDGDRLGSISVNLTDKNTKTPLVGAELSLYYVATVELNTSYKLGYTFTPAFEDCGAELADPDLSAKLDVFVKQHPVSSKKLITDAYGKASFTDLPLGLYFVRQTNTVAGFAPCNSFLVTVPNYTADTYVYDVNASPKTDVTKLANITIRKVWNTSAAAAAAYGVNVQLLRAGTVVRTVTLSPQNNWQVTFTDMPASDAYSIVELNVPRGFVASYSRNGYVFTVTNSAALAQTGQLVWPIPVLAITGLALITIGTVILRKSRKSNG